MQLIIIGIVIFFLFSASIAVFQQIGIGGAIALLIGGGIGFALGNNFYIGWGVYGAILGGLIAAFICFKKINDNKSVMLGILILLFLCAGAGFAIGNKFSFGWGLFGCILGGLIGIYPIYGKR